MAEFDFLEQGLSQKADTDRRTKLPICRPFVHLSREKLGCIENESITEFAWNSRLHLDHVPRTCGISCFDVNDRQLVILEHLVVIRIEDFNFFDRVLRLEHCVEDSLRSYDREFGERAFEMRTTFQGMRPEYYTQFIDEVSRQYVCEGRAGKARFRRLPDMLRMLSPASREYREYASFLEGEAKKEDVDPHGLYDSSDWPDFKW